MKEYPHLSVVLDEVSAREGHAEGQAPWWTYCAEVLDHVRVPYDVVPAIGDLGLDGPGVLLFPEAPSLPDDQAAAVRAWVEGGGALLCTGAGSLGAAFGVAEVDPVADGYVLIDGADGWLDGVDVPLRAQGGNKLAVGTDAVVLASWAHDKTPAIVLVHLGLGVAIFSGVDIWQSIVRIQQGDPVYTDGVPAADGSAAVDDGSLKCDDGIVLSYETDREVPPQSAVRRAEGRAGLDPVPIFHRPHADLWRGAFLQLLLGAARHCGVVLPWLYYWPAGVPAVAHLSVDSDRNSIEDAATSLDLFDEIGVRTTWCHVYPGGYDTATVERIGAAGHEHALHFNAVGDADIASWGWAQLRAQHAWAQAMTGHEEIVSNKNHYTRWEGWDEFYRWCVRLGIEIDETRGPSKRGNVGFPFGTAHLAKPMSGTRRLDVLMLPMHAQDLAWTTHESVRNVILDQVVAQHGVAHFLFHPVHLHRRSFVRDACRDVVAEATRRGLPWWTAAQLNAWERLRRNVVLDVRHEAGGGLAISAHAPNAIPGAAIMLPLPDPSAQVETAWSDSGSPVRPAVVERHGMTMLELATDLAEGTTTLHVTWAAVAAAPDGELVR
ncbi:hypothetical protein [Phytoactinopolyspora mesophila]|uniref:Uncharacterized protein n=1 Tax=Phytoactinopolyspora mesophila TaxID=2650750 RepID=A0A7K3M4R3_9ACTN|nr:hypothetical protein [Phytoactinopolyspora mesophila]NDL58236.1 hypothetical protein [Phytoactinopolyspora mesophila]